MSNRELAEEISSGFDAKIKAALAAFAANERQLVMKALKEINGLTLRTIPKLDVIVAMAARLAAIETREAQVAEREQALAERIETLERSIEAVAVAVNPKYVVPLRQQIREDQARNHAALNRGGV
jgi:hypothetical protein